MAGSRTNDRQTGNKDPAVLLGSYFPHVSTEPTGQREFYHFMIYCTWHLSWHRRLHLFWGSVVYSQIAIFPLSAFCSVKYSTVYYHFILLQLFSLTVVRGSLDSESLPLSNSICLNVKKKKKVELLKIPAICLAFLKKYLIGVVFLSSTCCKWGR